MFACEKPEDTIREEIQNMGHAASTQDMKSGEPNGSTVLGAARKNPYTVANMLAAQDSLVRKGNTAAGAIEVRTTHKYIRFLPENTEELDRIVQDLNPILFEVPLDREIIASGTHYHDPAIPDSVPTPQYTVVLADFNYSGVAWELLEEAYIPEDDPRLTNDTLINDLVVEAFTITDNGDMLDTPKGLFPSKWRPAGRIRVWDDVMNGLIPVKNCQVRTQRFLKIGVGYTNANGYYSGSKQYRYKVNYSIRWESPTGFRICDNMNWITAKYDGPHKKGDWNCDIGGAASTYKNMRFATIHRASNRYFNENRGGLGSPQLSIFLNLTYKHSEGGGINFGNLPYTLIGISHIRIWGKNTQGNFKKTENVFSTTIHEIGHSAHWKKMGVIDFAQTTSQIRESWADAIEWWLTRLEYYELGMPYADYDNYSPSDPSNEGFYDWGQRWNGVAPDYNDDYTPLFIDLVDNLNQSANSGSPSYALLPSDQCPGDPWYDGANCLVGTPPVGTSAFIYNDNFYYTPIGCCTCPMAGSSFDGANCYVQPVPSDRIGFE